MTGLLSIVVPVVALALPASAGAAGCVTGAPVSPLRRVAITPKVAVTPPGERIVAWEERQTGTLDVEDVAAGSRRPALS